MYLVLERDEQRRLTELVESRVREIHPEIRRCRQYRFQQELKDELACLEQLLRRLHEAECDVTA